jgi:hypothetical protein
VYRIINEIQDVEGHPWLLFVDALEVGEVGWLDLQLLQTVVELSVRLVIRILHDVSGGKLNHDSFH